MAGDAKNIRWCCRELREVLQEEYWSFPAPTDAADVIYDHLADVQDSSLEPDWIDKDFASEMRDVDCYPCDVRDVARLPEEDRAAHLRRAEWRPRLTGGLEATRWVDRGRARHWEMVRLAGGAEE